MLIGERTAEELKKRCGAALPVLDNPPDDVAINGRDLMTGVPKQIVIHYSELHHALDKSISKIEEAVLRALNNTPPELASDIYKSGLFLTGGARQYDSDQRISLKTKLPVHIADDPLRAVVRGTGTGFKKSWYDVPFLMS